MIHLKEKKNYYICPTKKLRSTLRTITNSILFDNNCNLSDNDFIDCCNYIDVNETEYDLINTNILQFIYTYIRDGNIGTFQNINVI